MAEVLPAQIQPSCYSHSSLRRSTASHSSLIAASSRRSNYGVASKEDTRSNSLPSSVPSSPQFYPQESSYGSSFPSSSTSSFSLDTDYQVEDEVKFPSYDGGRDAGLTINTEVNPPLDEMEFESDIGEDVDEPPTTAVPPALEPASRPEDDIALRHEPTRHVDYLSHDWTHEDIWCSWKHIVANRRYYGERSRLENASWRTWAKIHFKLNTIAPETIHWLKDCDVTWLYGPLQTASNRPLTQLANSQTSASGTLSKSNSFLNKKPILKKRSMSEIMLQKSISTSSLVKQATAVLEAQRATDYSSRKRHRGLGNRAPSDLATPDMPSDFESRITTNSDITTTPASSVQSPTVEKRHIRWDNTVEQCIAVDVKDIDEYGERDAWVDPEDSSSEDDDGIIMMKPTRRKASLSCSSSRSSFSSESKTIAMLPSTTLKDRTQTPGPGHALPVNSGYWSSKPISPSPSQETLRPARPSAKFMLDEDDDENDINWDPPRFDGPSYVASDGPMFENLEEDEESSHDGLRRTPSGMLMPYDPDGSNIPQSGLVGRVVDTVNTARDIAHVIWNVGWKRT